jgi:beta-lactamase regulating signal transducer with metallopeptidase domain
METLLYIGLSNALIVPVLAVVVAGIGWVCRRPALMHSLWLLVLLKLLTPPLWPVRVPWPAPAEAAQTISPVVRLLEPVPMDSLEMPREPADQESFALPPAPATAPAAVASGPSGHLLVTATWLTGSFFWVVLAGWRWFRFQRLVRLAQPAPASFQDQARGLAALLGLRRCPAVFFLPGPVSPLLWAVVGRARLLVPADLVRRLTEEQRDTLLLHELAHLRRRDHWVRRLELVVLALYWWHPVVWWARHELQETEEQCCDAWVVWALPAAAPAYAAALVETVTFLSRSPAALPLGASGMGQVYLLKRRLSMILRGTTSPALSWLGFLVVLGVGAGLLPLAPSWAQKQPVNDSANPTPSQAAGDQPTQAKPTPRLSEPLQKPQASDRADEAREELELLQVQLEGKRAELQEAKARLAQGKIEVDRLQRLQPKGLTSETELARARSELDVLTARLVGKEVQVREAEIRLRYAQGRLASPPAPRPSVHGASLIGESIKDFGEVSGGAALTQRFILTNPTDTPVHIDHVRTSHACVLAYPDRQVVAPGNSTQIVARMDTSRFSGPKTVSIYVVLDPPERRSIELKLRATSRPAPATTDRPGPQVPDQSAPTGGNHRLLELEKKLDDLRKEIESLRRDLRPPQTGTTSPLAPLNVIAVDSRNFRIPIIVDKDRHQDLKELILFMSSDEGKTWHQQAVASPDQDAFSFHAPKDGAYWFTVCTVDTNARRSPQDVATAPPGLKVRVQTTKDTPKTNQKTSEETVKDPVRIGQIFISGNAKTPQEVILKAVPIFPGQVLNYAELRAAEPRLKRLKLSDLDPNVPPTITVLDPDSDSLCKDILIKVQEKKSSRSK